MSLQRSGFEFRVELAGDEPRVGFDLDHFHKRTVGRSSRDFQSFRLQCGAEIAVELITVAVTLGDMRGAVQFGEI